MFSYYHRDHYPNVFSSYWGNMFSLSIQWNIWALSLKQTIYLSESCNSLELISCLKRSHLNSNTIFVVNKKEQWKLNEQNLYCRTHITFEFASHNIEVHCRTHERIVRNPGVILKYVLFELPKLGGGGANSEIYDIRPRIVSVIKHFPFRCIRIFDGVKSSEILTSVLAEK